MRQTFLSPTMWADLTNHHDSRLQTVHQRVKLTPAGDGLEWLTLWGA